MPVSPKGNGKRESARGGVALILTGSLYLLPTCAVQRADMMLSILGMTFGRPMMIPASHCRIGLPQPIEMEVRAAADFDVNKAMSVSFLSATM